MSSMLIGFPLLILILALSFEKGTWGNYLQPHSILLVFGGSVAILLFSTPQAVLRSLFSSLRALFVPEDSFSDCREELLKLTRNRASLSKSSRNPLITYATELWSQGVDPELVAVLLSQKRNELESRSMDAVQAMKNLAKYPPALGMAGTVMGMISLFSKLDQNKDHIGGSLSLAMTATFFGLILANAVISPLADRLHVRLVNQQRFHESVYEILLLINRGEAGSLIREELNERAA